MMPVFFNGKSPVHTASQGTLVTIDVCYDRKGNRLPYINIAHSEDAANTSTSVFINGNPACHLQSIFSKSTGNENSAGGIYSGTISGQAEFVTGSTDIFIEGIPAVRAGDKMVSNNQNTAPAPLQQA